MVNKQNFQRELDKIINNHVKNKDKPSLLLHSCCGPCSSYVLEYLSRYFIIKLFFYNPNIWPAEEYYKRLEAQKDVLNKMTLSNVEFIVGEYNPGNFYLAVKGFETEPEGGKRCEICIKMRIMAAAKEALTYNTDYFATTLTVSPHKNAPYINSVGKSIENEISIPYLVSDFKKKNGYKRSVELCRLYDIYRQDYCGCIFSKK